MPADSRPYIAKPAAQTPAKVASPSTGHSTPTDRRRRRVDTENTTYQAAAPSAKRPRTSGRPPIYPAALVSPSAPAAMLGVQKGPVSGRPAAKKLVIKNRRVDSPGHKAQVERYFDRTWEEVNVAVQAVLAGEKVPMPLDRVYRGVEDLCRNGRERDVYDRLRDACAKHITSMVLPAVKRQWAANNIGTLEAVLAEWKTYSQKSRLIRSTFSFLDRTYLRKQNDCNQINDMMIGQFRKAISSSSASKLPDGQSIAQAVVNGICSLVQLARDKDSRFAPALLRDSIVMLHVFGVYQKWFERTFVERSTAWLKEFSNERLTMSLENYTQECQRVLDEEASRCDEYDFDSTTKRMLLEAARKALVADHADKMLDVTSLSRLVTGCDAKSLSGLYQLLQFADMDDKLKAPWNEHIRSAGSAIVKDTARHDEMVARLLELKQSLDLVLEAFGNDETLRESLREAFRSFMNDQKNVTWETGGTAKIGEMVAKYIDMLLRGGLKALPRALLSGAKAQQEADADAQAADEDGELDRQLDRAVALFRFIEGKDAFEAFYKRDLARRLLMDRSASQDAERTMLGKLKGECGANFTHNLEQMFKDKVVAKDVMEAYRQSCISSNYKPPFDLQVMVLSSGAWPSYPDIRVTLPPELAGPLGRFDAYYKDKNSGRLLSWKHGLAHCVITARFKRGKKELLVSALQAIVLLLFEGTTTREGDDQDKPLGYSQIAQATGLAGPDLSRTLQSLACGRHRVLTKHPRSRDVSATDTFTFNADFWDARFKIKINQIQMKETKEENKATHDKVIMDRRLETQAAIVRIMKSRKELGHALLVAEVIEMTRKRGPVDAGQIKKEIESLIEKDFLEREGDAYTYLA